MQFLHSSNDSLGIVQLQQNHNCRTQQNTAPPADIRKRKTKTMAFITANHTATNSFAERASALFAQVSGILAQRKLYNTTFNELQSLSNRDLADLGIHRSMIKSIALDAVKK